MDDFRFNIIGAVATYHGDGHPYLDGYTVRVVAVIKRPGGDPDAGSVCWTNAELVAAGGLDAALDVLDVSPWLGKPYFRWSLVTSDVHFKDLVNIRETR